MTVESAPSIIAAERQRADELMITLQVNEYQAQCLASGFVPQTVKAAAMDCLSWLEQDEARAQRPEKRTRQI